LDFREYHKLKSKENRKKNFTHWKARDKTKYIKPKSKCEICGSSNNREKHHPDYKKPMFLITLCRNCHAKIHRKYK
jgi:hypothetical protein